MLDKIADHEDQVILTKKSCKSTSVSVDESTNIDNPTSSLFFTVSIQTTRFISTVYTQGHNYYIGSTLFLR